MAPPLGPFSPRVGGMAPLAPGAGSAVPYRGVDTLDPFHQARPKKPPQAVQKSVVPRARLPKTPQQISHLFELGLTSAAMSFHEAALENAREVTSLAPDHAGGWQLLARMLRLSGQDAEATAADAKASALAGAATRWRDAEGERSPARLERLDLKLKERLENTPDEERIGLLRDLLFADPLNVAAMRYLANEEEQAEDLITASQVLERALALSPIYTAARVDYAKLLMEKREFLEAFTQSEYLVAANPNSAGHRLLRADAAMHTERYDVAVAVLESLLKQDPSNEWALNSYARALRIVGKREQSVKNFRTLLAVAPTSGAAYFGLSELKANYLTQADVAAMQAFLAGGVGEVNSRRCMAYAIGQTLERARDYAGSFAAYEYGARLSKEEIADTPKAHDPDKFAERLGRIRKVFTAENIAARAVPPGRDVATTPIFVLGMPRAGSTLVEQILASHSLVEATRELPVVSSLVKKIAMSRAMVAPDVYPERVLEYGRAQWDALGEECLRGIALYRKSALPFVIDKRPWNWIDAAFIHLMLPQAKMIDIRRRPMAAGFAMFKQMLPVDAAFSYDLQHLGRYYRDYVAFMDYLDSVMPGRVLRVSYDRLVDDTEGEIRRMLDYCGLPFEENCLRFWETNRGIMTPSAEQVRRPIFRDALEQWKNYEAWLGPLKEALGDLVEDHIEPGKAALAAI